jgi:hypothetical protein
LFDQLPGQLRPARAWHDDVSQEYVDGLIRFDESKGLILFSHSPEHPKTMDFECSKSCPSPDSEHVWMKLLTVWAASGLSVAVSRHDRKLRTQTT